MNEKISKLLKKVTFMDNSNVFHFPNDSKFKPRTKKEKGFMYFVTMVTVYPFAVTYIIFKQIMCDHEVITVGTTYLKNGVKIKAKACVKCKKLYQGY